MEFVNLESEVAHVLRPPVCELSKAIVTVVDGVIGPIRRGVDDNVGGVKPDGGFNPCSAKAA